MKPVLLFLVLVPIKLYGFESLENEDFFDRWLQLSYYKKDFTGKYVSDIVNPEFFLAKNGYEDPIQEFYAYKTYLQQYINDKSNINEICRFPARFSFFKDNFGWMKDVRRPQCQNYEKSNRPDKVTSISLVLANGYYANPGSYYGHNLLKFNYGESIVNQETIDASLNYGARATDKSTSIAYIFKGLFGLYDGVYTRNDNFIYTNNYTNTQMRDVWEYVLDLTDEEKINLIEHSWEMSFAKFRYYFLSDNCAHRISNLISFVKRKELLDNKGFWLTPVQLVRLLEKQNIYRKTIYNPSLQTILSDKYNEASKVDKSDFIKFLKSSLDEQKIMSPSISSDGLIMSLDYLDILVAGLKTKEKNNEKINLINQQRSVVLNELYKRPAEKVNNYFQSKQPESPSKTKPTSVIRVGYENVHGTEDYIKLLYRATNNDLLNIPTSGQNYSQFHMGNFELKIQDNNLNVSQAVFAEVTNIDTNPLPFSLAQKYSWQIKADYSQRNSLCNDCSSYGMQGKVGLAKKINDNMQLYFLTGARFHTKEKYTNNNISQITDFGSLINIYEDFVINISTNFNYNIQDDYADKLYKAQLAYSPKGLVDYRISAEADEQKYSFMFNVGYYFD